MVKLKRERSQQRASGVFTCSFLLGSSVLRSCICSLCPRVTVGFRLFNYTFFIGDFSDSVQSPVRAEKDTKEEEEEKRKKKDSLIQAVGTVLKNRLQQRQKKCENLYQFYIFFVVVFGVLQKQCGHRQKFFVLPAFIFYSNTIKFSTDAKNFEGAVSPNPTHPLTHTVFCEH